VTTGEYLFRAGEVPAEVFFITSGRVETRKSGQVIRDFTTGSAVGGLAALGDNLHGYDCVAVEDSTLIVLKMTHMTDIFEEHFQIIRAVLSAISGQMLDLRQAVGPDGGYGETTWEPDGPPPPRMNLIERLALLRGAMKSAWKRAMFFGAKENPRSLLCLWFGARSKPKAPVAWWLGLAPGMWLASWGRSAAGPAGTRRRRRPMS
jgi:hypothetical protein